ncbi:MAG: hypothetical protein ACRC1K_11150 [Planctomycetia bacterium]
MAELTIRLQWDPVSRKRDIVVALRSDDDALPHEHEQLHRRLVDKLTAAGLLAEGEAGRLVVEREAAGATETVGDGRAASNDSAERAVLSEGG